jgi:O-antigen ligase
VLVLGLIFGNAKLAERYAETSIFHETARFDLHKFGFAQFKNFWLFGYGAGGFENVFKLFYNIKDEYIAKHVHNVWIELLGEVGIIGISIWLLLFITYFKKLLNRINEKKEFSRFILISLLLLILFIQSWVEFSIHIPGISILLTIVLSIGLINFKKE